MESTLGGDAMKIVGTTTQDLEYDINLVAKAMVEFERTVSIFFFFSFLATPRGRRLGS